MERLHKRLARAGFASRRSVEDLIRAGRVTVNGEVATVGQTVSEADEVRVDGRLVDLTPAPHVTYLLYKPRGVVTSVRDELGRDTVIDHMPPTPGLHPVGRLDRDSEGLLLLTTDGELTLRLTHPRYGHEKEYRAWVAGQLTADVAQLLVSGVELEDGMSRAAEVTLAPRGAYVTLREGRNRQVRRMLDAIGHPVRRLVRVRFGGLFLGDVEPGEYRTLTPDDLHELEHPESVPARVWREQMELTRERWG